MHNLNSEQVCEHYRQYNWLLYYLIYIDSIIHIKEYYIIDIIAIFFYHYDYILMLIEYQLYLSIILLKFIANFSNFWKTFR